MTRTAAAATDAPPALGLRFEVPRSEVDRARSRAASDDFDRAQLRGKVHFDLAVPFEADPVLEFLREKRGLSLSVPHTVSLDQPVGYVIGHLAAATVLAAHGEASPMIMLAGSAGALGVARESVDTLALSLPLAQYAGVALVGTADAARAVGGAARALFELLGREVPVAAHGPFGRFLEREARILESVAGRGAPPPLDPLVIEPSGLASLARTAEELERAGAHVVPYWVTRADGNRVAFEPLRAPAAPGARGALGLAILPQGVRLMVARPGAAPDPNAQLRRRLGRPSPFVAVLSDDGANITRFESPRGSLAMAPPEE